MATSFDRFEKEPLKIKTQHLLLNKRVPTEGAITLYIFHYSA